VKKEFWKISQIGILDLSYCSIKRQ